MRLGSSPVVLAAAAAVSVFCAVPAYCAPAQGSASHGKQDVTGEAAETASEAISKEAETVNGMLGTASDGYDISSSSSERIAQSSARPKTAGGRIARWVREHPIEAGAAVLLTTSLLMGSEHEPRAASRQPNPPQPPSSAGAAAAGNAAAPPAAAAAAQVLTAHNTKPNPVDNLNGERPSSADTKQEGQMAQRDAAYKHLQTLLREEPGFWRCFEEWLFIAGINSVNHKSVRFYPETLNRLVRSCIHAVPHRRLPAAQREWMFPESSGDGPSIRVSIPPRPPEAPLFSGSSSSSSMSSSSSSPSAPSRPPSQSPSSSLSLSTSRSLRLARHTVDERRRHQPLRTRLLAAKAAKTAERPKKSLPVRLLATTSSSSSASSGAAERTESLSNWELLQTHGAAEYERWRRGGFDRLASVAAAAAAAVAATAATGEGAGPGARGPVAAVSPPPPWRGMMLPARWH